MMLAYMYLVSEVYRCACREDELNTPEVSAEAGVMQSRPAVVISDAHVGSTLHTPITINKQDKKSINRFINQSISQMHAA